MKIRIARHTANLAPLIHFYHKILGLEILGRFENHETYHGVFLGPKSAEWHLEFTTSNQAPQHQPDEDDLLVFYLSEEAYLYLKKKLDLHGIPEVIPKNPYWRRNGLAFTDPDGFQVILAKEK